MPRTATEWTMVLLFGIGIVCWLFAGLVSGFGFAGFSLGLICFGILVALGFISFREIPAQPPSVAMPTFLGEREDSIVREGLAFACPGIEDFIVVNYLPEEGVLTLPDVRCLLKDRGTKKISGGAVTLKIPYVWVPDTDDPDDNKSPRLRLFLNNGEREGVKSMFEGMLGAAARQLASTMTWEELAFSKVRLSADLIGILTGVNLPPGATEDEVKEHLTKALTNGVADIRDLGIKIRRINLTEVVPEGALKASADRAAEQLLERNAQKIEVVTAITVAQDIFDAAKKNGSEISFQEALKAARIQLGLATETIVRSDNPLTDAAAILRQPPPSPKST